MLIMCKSHLFADVIDCTDYYVTGGCEIVIINFQGTAILCIYCQSEDIDLTIIESLNRFIITHNLAIILLGNFIAHHKGLLVLTLLLRADLFGSFVNFTDWHNLLIFPHVAPQFWI